MDVEIVHHEMPASNKRFRLDSAFDMVEKVHFVSRATVGRSANLSPGDIKVDDERLRAVPDVLELLVFYCARSHWQRGMLALQGLHAAQLIRTHHLLTFLNQLWRLAIQTIDVFNFLVKSLIMNVCQPIADPVRLKIAFFLKASLRVWARFRLQCLVS